MAREMAAPAAAAPTTAPSLRDWLEDSGLLWDRLTPDQVRRYLVERDGLTPAEASDYVWSLRGTQAGALMRW